jgi:cell division protein FtsB
MNFWTMVVIVVFLSFAGTVGIMQQVKSMRRQNTDGEETEKLKAHIADLEERVRTLERIATDKKTKLKDEIETL